MADVSVPQVGSRWRDTEGEDGIVEVVDYEKGYVVATIHDRLGGEVLIQPGHFGRRYVALGVREDGEEG